MERVQFQQEQMLAELKDLVRKGLFSQLEVKQIMKKRTAFETALVRRVAKKGDFLRYAAYEMGLETLRRKRVGRLKLPPSPPSISDYALVRRQFYIFERALKKFKGDVGMWVQYIQVAKRENARALVGRISARALQLHPNSPALYILAASHELTHLSPSSARTLLQRGIRLNSESVDLWREYIKMELGFIESLRRRWEVLGLNEEDMEKGARVKPIQTLVNVEDTTGMDVDVPLIATEDAEVATDEGEIARKEVMQGALVKTVISNAVKALPNVSLFTSIHSLLVSYPCPSSLRRSLLDHLHSLLHSTFSTTLEPQAAKLYATRFLTPELEGVELVEAIRRANDDLLETVKLSRGIIKDGKQKVDRDAGVDGVAKAYAEFVEEWFEKDIDDNLKIYLLSTLQSLCSSYPAPPLLETHLRLLSSPLCPSPHPSEKLLRLAQKYTSKASKVAALWLLRLNLEAAFGQKDGWKSVWQEARRCTQSSNKSEEELAATETVWFWGLERNSNDHEEVLHNHETLLRESMLDPLLSPLQEKLLIRYMLLLLNRAETPKSSGQYTVDQRERVIQRVAREYMPNARVWAAIFEAYSQPSSSAEMEGTLRSIFDKWRLESPQDYGDAALAWAKWLVRQGSGREAGDVIARARVAMDGEHKTSFECQWKEWLDSFAHGESEQAEEKNEPTTAAAVTV